MVSLSEIADNETMYRSIYNNISVYREFSLDGTASNVGYAATLQFVNTSVVLLNKSETFGITTRRMTGTFRNLLLMSKQHDLKAAIDKVGDSQVNTVEHLAANDHIYKAKREINSGCIMWPET